MKKFYVFFILFFILCICSIVYGAELSSDVEKISSISDTSKCTFIKNDYVDTMRPSKKFYFVQVRTHKAGGDAYKILSTNDEAVPGLLNSRTYLVHFEIWKCKNDETKVEN